jgi:Zn-dependent protease
MTDPPSHVGLPYTAVGRVEPPPRGGFVLRRDDFGAFRAIEPGTNDLLVLRPTSEGLSIERPEGREIVPWTAVEGVELTFTEAGRAKVPTVRVRFATGPSLDWTDALAPGVDGLPLTLGPGCNPLLRVERHRMLTAVVASAAGLSPATPQSFHRGPRGVPVPELVTRPRVMPRWAQPLLFLGSVAAFMFVFDVRWKTALLVTLVLLFHELGHAVVMKLLGMKVRGVVFVPLFGAATVPEHAFSSRWDEARVSLAGPATGLPTAGVLAALLVFGTPAWLERDAVGIALLWALGVNLFNLAPMPPLDGGRVVTCLAAGLSTLGRAVASYLPIALVAACLLLIAGKGGIVLAALFVGLSVSLARAGLRRQTFLAWMEGLPQPPSSVRSSLRDVTHGFTGRAREDVDGGVLPTPLTSSQLAVVVGVYVVEALLLFGAALLSAVLFPAAFEALKGGG